MCLKQFAIPSAVMRVITFMGEKPRKCDVCHKRFTETGSLTRHIFLIKNNQRIGDQLCVSHKCQMSLTQHNILQSHSCARRCRHIVNILRGVSIL